MKGIGWFRYGRENAALLNQPGINDENSPD